VVVGQRHVRPGHKPGSSVGLDPHQVGAPLTCRDRTRQLLVHLEEQGPTPRHELTEVMGSTQCSMGHDLHWASLMSGLLHLNAEGAVSIGRLGIDWLDEHGRPGPAWGETIFPGSKSLREWQVASLTAWSDHGRHGVIQAVTGTGKSRVGVEAIREALSHDFSVVVAVPTVDLVDQWTRALGENGVRDVGALADGQKSTFMTHSVVVGTVQSLYQAPPERADGKVLLVADECHRYGAGEWRRVLHPTYRRRLGLTATFERNDDGIHDLLRYFGGRPVYEIGFPQAIAEEVVAHYDVKLLGVSLTAPERAAYTEADEMLRDARMSLLSAGFPSEPFGAFLHAVQMAAEGDPDPTVEDVARRYLKAFSTRVDIMTGARAKLDAATTLAPKVQSSNGAILFTRRVDVADEMASLLKDEGVQAEAVHSRLTRQERCDRLTDLKVGRLKALVAPTVLDEGIDVPNIDLAVVLGGSKSRRQMIQRMGRVLRLKPDEGKATFIVVYAKNTVEDLNQNTGVEGCLDLIIEAADSVEELASIDRLAEPIQADVVQVVESSTESEPVVPVDQPATADADAEPKVEISMQVDARLAALDPWSLPMTRRALNDYQRLHGGTDDQVDFALRDMLRDLQGGCQVRDGNSPGVFVARHSGFALALAADRFVAYTTKRGKSVTWATRLDYELTTADAGPALLGSEVVQVEESQVGCEEPIEQRQITPETDVRPPETGHQTVTVANAALQASVGDRLIAHLDRLVQLREAGHLSDREFAAAKEKLLF
jgi:superfamily II DNA or RNA helicase